MEQPKNKHSINEPILEPDPQSGKPKKSLKKMHKPGRKGLLVALKRLSVIQTVGIAMAIAAMSVGTAYFVLVKPQQPETDAFSQPVSGAVQQPVTSGIAPVSQEPPQVPVANPVSEVLRWTYETEVAKTLSAPVSHGGHVLASTPTTLYSVAYEGDLRWEFNPPDKGMLTAPAVKGGSHVHVATHYGHVYALNGWGEIDWEFDTKATVIGKPAVNNKGYMVVGSQDLICINPWGDEYWTFSPEDTRFIRANPVMANNILVTGTSGKGGGVLFALSYKGELLWELDLNLHFEATPTVDKQGTIYVYSNKTQMMHSISKAGEILWSKNIRGNQRSCISLMPDGSLLVGGFDSIITCFSPDGTVLWSTRAVASQDHASLVGSDGLIYVEGSDSVLVLNLDGSILCRIKLPKGTVTGLAQGPGGSVYASTSGHQILSLDLTD